MYPDGQIYIQTDGRMFYSGKEERGRLHTEKQAYNVGRDRQLDRHKIRRII